MRTSLRPSWPRLRRLLAAGVVAVALGTGAAMPAGTAAPAPPTTDRWTPAVLPAAWTEDADQLVVGRWDSWTATRGRLSAWQRDELGIWRPVLRAPARAGWSGLVPAARRRQGSGDTPVGSFALGRAAGFAPDPGTALRYRPLDDTDHWVYDPRDPATYNLFQPFRSRHAAWRRGWAEHVVDWADREYRYLVEIGFNRPEGVRWDPRRRQRTAAQPADVRRGGGIFLHVHGGGPTSGCVSVPEPAMVALLRWLDPSAAPRLVVAPPD